MLLIIGLLCWVDPYLVSHQSGTIAPPYLREYDYISIAGYYFNPKEKLPEIPAELTGASNYFLIHLKGPIYDGMKQTMESYGVKLIQYIPFNAFITKMDETKKVMIENLSFVNWVGYYEPAFKLSTCFNTIKNENQIRVQIFYDEDEYLVKNKLMNLGCEILEVVVDQFVKIITVRTDLGNLSKIARLSEVMYLEPYLEPVLFNNLAQWVTQTWKQANRRIWRKGILGQGQVVSTADTGILTSHDMICLETRQFLSRLGVIIQPIEK